MLELRLLNREGNLTPTANEKVTPTMVGLKHWEPGDVALAEYCFNEDGQFLRWKKNLPASQMAIVIYDKKGKLETLFVQGKRVGDETKINETLEKLLDFPMTYYNLEGNKFLVLIYIPFAERAKGGEFYEKNSSRRGENKVLQQIYKFGSYSYV